MSGTEDEMIDFIDTFRKKLQIITTRRNIIS